MVDEQRRRLAHAPAHAGRTDAAALAREGHPQRIAATSALGHEETALELFAGREQRVTGASEEARALLERALAIQEEALGTEHPTVAGSLNNLAQIHLDAGTYEEAQALFERALRIREKALGTEHPAVASSLNNLAVVHFKTEAYEEARALYERALAIKEKTLGPDHPEVATTLGNLALAHRETGDASNWRALIERAVAIYDRHDMTQENEPTARFELAKALVATGGDRTRARSLAEQARDGYRASGEGKIKELEAVEAWLAAHER